MDEYALKSGDLVRLGAFYIKSRLGLWNPGGSCDKEIGLVADRVLPPGQQPISLQIYSLAPAYSLEVRLSLRAVGRADRSPLCLTAPFCLCHGFNTS